MALIDVVKYNGPSDVFAWKFPNEELSTWTQLIVNESQEAVFVKGGTVLDVFGSGRHTLSTENIPLLRQFIKLPFGGRSPFTAEIWFINKAHKPNIRWGTSSPIQLQDAKYGIMIPVRSNGTFGIQIDDSKTFLVKLIGTLPDFDEKTIEQYFKGIYLTKIKDKIASFLAEKQISILEINAYLDDLSQYMLAEMRPVFAEYGIALNSFNINDINVPEDDEGVKQLKDALAKRSEMDIMGYTYQQERSFDVMEEAAKNPGSTASTFMGAGMGIGMGLGLGKTSAVEMGNISKAMDLGKEIPGMKICGNCGSSVPENSKFCPECGHPFAKHCPKCGAEIIEGQKFCGNCGASLQEG